MKLTVLNGVNGNERVREQVRLSAKRVKVGFLVEHAR